MQKHEVHTRHRPRRTLHRVKVWAKSDKNWARYKNHKFYGIYPYVNFPFEYIEQCHYASNAYKRIIFGTKLFGSTSWKKWAHSRPDPTILSMKTRLTSCFPNSLYFNMGKLWRFISQLILKVESWNFACARVWRAPSGPQNHLAVVSKMAAMLDPRPYTSRRKIA